MMTAGQFLRTVWPDTGLYCLAHPFVTPSGVETYKHHVFSTISDAVTHVHQRKEIEPVFFAVLTLKEEKVWDPEKVDWKTGQKGAWTVRKQTNASHCKTAFWDLDVGEGPTKYPTRQEAALALLNFIKVVKLPLPLIVSSGSGLHVYWPFNETITAEEGAEIASYLKALGQHHGMRMDKSRTTDIASVLRVPESYNMKNGGRRLVEVKEVGTVSPYSAFRQALLDAAIAAGITPEAPTKKFTPRDDHGLGVQTFNDFGDPPTLDDVIDACGQMQEVMRAATKPDHPNYRELGNDAWYKGLISLVYHVEDGENWCRKLTNLFPRDKADVEAKISQLAQGSFGPARCSTLREQMPWGESPCAGCRFRHDAAVPNPLVAARRSKLAPPPAPALELHALGAGIQSVLIPNPPMPYERLADGRIALNRKDKDGNNIQTIIYDRDLYPIKRMVNNDTKTEQQTWRVTLPRTGAKDFVIDADALYDSRKFVSAISNNGIYPHKADIPALQDYMVAYIAQLQKDLDGEIQSNHLGWIDDYNAFITPEKTLLRDGTARTTSLTNAARKASEHIRKKGTLERQVQLMGFFNRDEYIPNQFIIGCALGSVIFHATGHHGVIVNMSGDAGASKSTTLYSGASMFGDPTSWVLNGTNRGATANGRMQRIATNANYPTCVDEITHLPVKEAQDLAMSVTQPGHRLRLGPDGTELPGGSKYKAAIMLTTANSSLHTLLSQDNAAGTAGSMRVFEIKFRAQNVHTKAEADDFLRELKENFGHIGEQVLLFVIRHLDKVNARVQQVQRELDIEAGITSAERFWSAPGAVALVMLEIAQALHLLPYDPAKIRSWLVTKQIPLMRGIVKEEYRDPLAILTDYIAEKHGNIVVVDKTTSIGANTSGQMVQSDTAIALNTPHGALLGHYDVRAGVLYLLKQAFKEHCNRVGASASRILEELNQPRLVPGDQLKRIVVERAVRRTPGAGTPLAKGQCWCFAVDMNHPDISGIVPLVPVQGGGQTSAPAGNLKAVP